MTESELIEALRAWGLATVNRFAYTKADRSTHILAKTRDMAPGTRENAEKQLMGRAGRERRRFMARMLGMKGFNIIPTWAVDPVPATNDASPPHDNPEAAVDQGIPETLRWVDRQLNAMRLESPLRAKVVCTEYTVSASQKVKARMVAEDYGGSLSLWQYRRELQRAHDLLRGSARAA